jgi:hypothetical protein
LSIYFRQEEAEEEIPLIHASSGIRARFYLYIADRRGKRKIEHWRNL